MTIMLRNSCSVCTRPSKEICSCTFCEAAKPTANSSKRALLIFVFVLFGFFPLAPFLTDVLCMEKNCL